MCDVDYTSMGITNAMIERGNEIKHKIEERLWKESGKRVVVILDLNSSVATFNKEYECEFMGGIKMTEKMPKINSMKFNMQVIADGSLLPFVWGGVLIDNKIIANYPTIANYLKDPILLEEIDTTKKSSDNDDENINAAMKQLGFKKEEYAKYVSEVQKEMPEASLEEKISGVFAKMKNSK